MAKLGGPLRRSGLRPSRALQFVRLRRGRFGGSHGDRTQVRGGPNLGSGARPLAWMQPRPLFLEEIE
jgi:hypothetical protein